MQPAEHALPRAVGAMVRPWSGRQLVCLYICVATIVCLPLLAVEIPPLLDYPNHLARAHVLSHLESDAVLAASYQSRWRPLPNLANDAILMVLSRWTGVYVAGKIFLALSLLATLAGTAYLHRVLWREWHWWPVMAALFVHHGAFIAGFMNFTLGVGLSMAATAAWIQLGRAPVALRVLIGLAMALGLFFVHLSALAFYGALIGGHYLVVAGAGRPWRLVQKAALIEGLIIALQFVLPALLYLSAPGDTAVASGPWTAGSRVRGLMMPLLSYGLEINMFWLSVVLALMVYIWRCAGFTFASTMAPALAVFFLGFLILPSNFADTAFVAERFPIIAVLVGIAALRPAPFNQRRLVAVAALLGLIFVGRTAMLTHQWRSFGDYLADLRAGLDTVAVGAVVESAMSFEDYRSQYNQQRQQQPGWLYVLGGFPNLIHMPSLAVIERRIFLPTMFTDPQKQPLAASAARRALDRDHGVPVRIATAIAESPIGRLELGPRLMNKDYLVVLYADALSDEALLTLPGIDVVHQGGRIIVLRLPDGVSLPAHSAVERM